MGNITTPSTAVQANFETDVLIYKQITKKITLINYTITTKQN